MNLLIGLIPAIAWGLLPVFLVKIGGSPYQQLLGTTMGTFLAAFIVQLVVQPNVSAFNFILCFLSGALWSIGQLGQYKAYSALGVSRAMPISTGLQLIGNTIMGVLFFHEWNLPSQLMIGSFAIGLIIIGILMATYEARREEKRKDIRKELWFLLLTTMGYIGYSALPKWVDAGGIDEFFPQAAGMLVSSALIVLWLSKSALVSKYSYKNIVSGLVFSISAGFYLISMKMNGMVIAFILSQMNVVVASVCGILLLQEKKTKNEMVAFIVGLLLVISGGMVVVSL